MQLGKQILLAIAFAAVSSIAAAAQGGTMRGTAADPGGTAKTQNTVIQWAAPENILPQNASTEVGHKMKLSCKMAAGCLISIQATIAFSNLGAPGNTEEICAKVDKAPANPTACYTSESADGGHAVVQYAGSTVVAKGAHDVSVSVVTGQNSVAVLTYSITAGFVP